VSPTAPVSPTSGALLQALADVVGAEHVVTDADLVAAHGVDWTRRWSGRPLAVVRPASTVETARVVRLCADHGVPVVPQGGNTGLVGGAVPRGEDSMVVLSTRRLQRLDPVDVSTRQVVVGAGVTLGAVHDHARAAGLAYGVDLAARDTATIGGNVATNAGGLHVVGHGDTRRQVVGLEAVLADGSVVSRLGGLHKDNGGYDLSQLLVGSEGTLGVVTAVRLRLLVPPAQPPVVTMVGLPSLADALLLLDQPGLTAAELVDDRGMRLVREVAGLPAATAREWPVYLLLETAGMPVLPERVGGEGVDGEGVGGEEVDAVVDDRVWEYRERQPEAIATLGVPHKLDVCLPVAGLPDFVDALPGVVADATAGRAQLYVYGHVGDGNLHVNLAGLDAHDEAADEAVLRLAAEHGGSIAAEHGVGVAKVAWLHLSRSAAEVAAMTAVKRALDPQGVMNPGVLLP
jgi:FAD/FMN-containing dehydrogenase